MNAIKRNSLLLGLIGTLIIWFLAILLGWYVKIESPVKDYKEIRIQLSDPSPVRDIPEVEEKEPVQRTEELPVVETEEEIPVIEETVVPVEEADVVQIPDIPASVEVQKTVESPKPVEQPKPAAPVQKTETVKPVEKNPVLSEIPAPVKETPKTTPSTAQIVKSVEELTKEASAKKKTAVFDESLFADDGDFTENTSQKTTPVNQKTSSSSSSSFEGSAAKGSESKTSESVQTSSSDSKKTDTSASSATRDNLDKFKDTLAVNKQNKTVEEKPSVTSDNGGVKSGSVNIEWSEGKSRSLLYPEKPVIKIPLRLQAQIDSTKKVKIKFRVLQNGNVTVTDIVITPSAILPLEVQNEIKKQISGWIFDEGDSDGQAVFDYSIIKE